MRSDIYVELTQDIKKLYALEASIIDGSHSESSDLRSKQALLISEVIQSLQKLMGTLRADSQVIFTEPQTFSFMK